MPACANCSKSQSKLNRSNLCKQCNNAVNGNIVDNGETVNANNTTIDGMNEYYMANCNKDNSDDINRRGLSQRDAMPNNNDINISAQQQNHQQQQRGSESLLSTELLDKSMSELTVREIIDVILAVNKPMNDKLDDVCREFDTKSSRLQTRVEFLETANIRKDEENNTLKSIIINMQRCLNKIDGNERNLNLIISGVSEENIVITNKDNGNTVSLTSDEMKISWLLRFIGNAKFVEVKLKD